ncbi:hypothetical protein H4O14_02405 [Bacillus sp. PAMC26568]|nr:hypothetical protein H4O14_02405 [Bacillus sp. PAMC26568]
MKIWVSVNNGNIENITTTNPELIPFVSEELPVYQYLLDIPYERIDDIEYIKNKISNGEAESVGSIK